MTPTNEEVRLIFEKALREAYQSGWVQGERERTTKRGGIPWNNSDLQRNGPDRLLTAYLALERERTAGLVEALRECEAQFRFYEANHRAKPDHAKADTNKAFAEKCSAALAAYDALKGEG